MLDIQAEKFYFFSADGVKAEIEEPGEVDVTVDDSHVIEAKDGQATVSLFCTLNYTVTITDDDPGSGWTDPDDGGRRYVFRRSGSVHGEDELEATLTLQYDPANPDQVTLGARTLSRQKVHVSFDDHDL